MSRAEYYEYIQSKAFVRLRRMVGVGKKKCQRCHREKARLPHHLHYRSLGHERRSDIVGVCHACNKLCHFYDNGRRVPVTTDGVYLRRRWKEITSMKYKFLHFRPSHILHL